MFSVFVILRKPFKRGKRTNVIFDVVIDPGCKWSEDELLEKFTSKIKAENETYCVVINFDRSYVN